QPLAESESKSDDEEVAGVSDGVFAEANAREGQALGAYALAQPWVMGAQQRLLASRRGLGVSRRPRVVAAEWRRDEGVLALRCLAQVTRLKDARLLVADADEAAGERDSVLLRHIERLCACAAGQSQRPLSAEAEAAHAAEHAHNVLHVRAAHVVSAKATHAFAISHAHAADFSAEPPAPDRIPQRADAARSRGLRSLARAVGATSCDLNSNDDGRLDELLVHAEALELVCIAADHPWFEVRKFRIASLGMLTISERHCTSLLKRLSEAQAEALVGSMTDSFFYTMADYAGEPIEEQHA
ncbi:hypothetical protein T492DRAFT_879574, partial [Pavlovales sp. CCMP2436]